MPETKNACVNTSLDPNVFYSKTFLMQLLQHNKGTVSLFNQNPNAASTKTLA
jgi:hypothetical protein